MKTKMEFSKKIFIGISILTAIIVIFSMVMIYRTNDLSPLSYLIPAVFAEMATATGFYYNKAKIENKIKILKGDGILISGSDDDLKMPEPTPLSLNDISEEENIDVRR